MNSDHLSEGDSELLKRLHEKVIDAEVVLSPTSSEAISLLHLKTDHAKLREIRDRQHPPLKLSEVVPRIRERSGWGDRERIAMRSSTVDEYVEVLSSLSGTELRQFLVEHLGWVRHGASDAAFEHGVNNFVEACRRIRAQRPGTRLSKLIEDSFRSNGVIDRLVEGPNADHTTHS